MQSETKAKTDKQIVDDVIREFKIGKDILAYLSEPSKNAKELTQCFNNIGDPDKLKKVLYLFIDGLPPKASIPKHGRRHGRRQATFRLFFD